jgi:hypothetical protein
MTEINIICLVIPANPDFNPYNDPNFTGGNSVLFCDPASGTVYRFHQLNPASIDENRSSKIGVFPNPETNEIAIEMGEVEITRNIVFLDQLGRIQYSSASKEAIQVNEWPRGVYFVQIPHIGEVVSKKIVLE